MWFCTRIHNKELSYCFIYYYFWCFENTNKSTNKNLLPFKTSVLAKNTLLQNSFVMVAVVIVNNYWLYF